MTIRRKFQLMLALPLFLILVPVSCWSGFSVAVHNTRGARKDFGNAVGAIMVTQALEELETQNRVRSGELTAAEGLEADREAQARADHRASTEMNAEVSAYVDHSFYLQFARISGGITLVVLCAAVIYLLYGYYKASKLHTFLWSRGYDMLTLRDAGMIYASVGNRAFALPKADTVLVIPGYGADPEGLVQYLRDHAEYQKQTKSLAQR